ncbi:hypothetical protein VNO77_38874 [Canavalia gladiata]|uniref:Uncharacterized protein n=1 Tax=Canavalia gladiata TaxID=3824 RepID=A0AAN9PZ69_CANGL
MDFDRAPAIIEESSHRGLLAKSPLILNQVLFSDPTKRWLPCISNLGNQQQAFQRKLEPLLLYFTPNLKLRGNTIKNSQNCRSWDLVSHER